MDKSVVFVACLNKALNPTKVFSIEGCKLDMFHHGNLICLVLRLMIPLLHLSDQNVRLSPQTTPLNPGLVSIVTQELASPQSAAPSSPGAMM